MNVGLGRGFQPLNLLRGHVGGCANQTVHVGHPLTAYDTGNAEVGQFHYPFWRNHQVGGFEVAVQNPPFVGVVQAFEGLLNNLNGQRNG